jgi:hypothetical protein
MGETSPARAVRRAPSPVWRVAIVDSGLDPQSGIVPDATRRFTDEVEQVREGVPVADATGHGTAVAQIIHSAWAMPAVGQATSRPGKCRRVACTPRRSLGKVRSRANALGGHPLPLRGGLLVAQVMDDCAGATPAAVASAIYWALESRATLIHLSLGLAHDRAVLASAVAAAVETGVLVVASMAARGTMSFPARYPGVLRATGDARCNAEEISVLDAAHETFGGCAAFTLPSGRLIRGASIGAAHVTRFVVSRLSADVTRSQLCDQLEASSSYSGRERRGGQSRIVPDGDRQHAGQISGEVVSHVDDLPD